MKNRDLYIPLCFLLINKTHPNIINADILYIPLCFLLIIPHLHHFRRRNILYIPLCFLLIQKMSIQEFLEMFFTFHYVSY